jgi:AraC-like DNA-binding protein
MATDQCNSESRLSFASHFGVVNSVESADGDAQRARTWDVRGHLHKMPSLQLRLPPRAAGRLDIRRPSINVSRRNDLAINCPSPAEQLLASAQEDISRLNEILRAQRCIAVVRGCDGTILPPNPVTKLAHGDGSNVAAGKFATASGDSSLSTPIFDSEGGVLASLDIVRGDAPGLDSSKQLLLALAESAARAITERWFRLVHRCHWVLAAMPRNTPDACIILAVDRNQRIVGANRQARQLLEQRGQRVAEGLSVLFRPNPTLLRRRGYGDVSTALFASGDGKPWIALITPPDPGAMESHCDARVWLHTRPRLDSLTRLSSLPSTGRAKRGLSQGALQRIEEYVEAHLDSALGIEELAAVVQMSSSHFSRSFHKSAGVTPHRYVIQNRVMRARELLATTDLPLTEIALTTGFSDQSHFSRRFHEIVGMPPGAFRGHEGHLTP